MYQLGIILILITQLKKVILIWIITFIIFAVIIGLSSYKKNSLSLSENVIDLERIYNLEITDLNNEVHDIISADVLCVMLENLCGMVSYILLKVLLSKISILRDTLDKLRANLAISKAIPNNISYMEDIERFTIQYWYENTQIK